MADRSLPVIWARAAARDLEEIVSFVASDSPVVAERLLGQLRAKADSLVREYWLRRHR
jgi:plasmid stabilization system protein ParE